jgi:hypothetical protein
MTRARSRCPPLKTALALARLRRATFFSYSGRRQRGSASIASLATIASRSAATRRGAFCAPGRGTKLATARSRGGLLTGGGDGLAVSGRREEECIRAEQVGVPGHSAAHMEESRRPVATKEKSWRRGADGPTARKAAMEFFIPGEPERCSSGVVACVRRSAAVREAERDIMIHAMVAVQMDGAARLDCGTVLRGAADLLRIPEHSLQVSKLRSATFLVCFEAQAQRNTALGREVLVVGRTRLHLMPWTRQFGASACRLFYRVRVCIEGVPPHAE